MPPPIARMTTNGSRSKSFLNLPAEIRNEIYRYLLISPNALSLTRLTQRKGLELFPQILRTCKTVRTEASTILYGCNTFGGVRLFWNKEGALELVNLDTILNCGTVNAALIRHIDMEDDITHGNLIGIYPPPVVAITFKNLRARLTSLRRAGPFVVYVDDPICDPSAGDEAKIRHVYRETEKVAPTWKGFEKNYRHARFGSTMVTITFAAAGETLSQDVSCHDPRISEDVRQ